MAQTEQHATAAVNFQTFTIWAVLGAFVAMMASDWMTPALLVYG